MKKLLWFLTGSIGDALIALALCHELAELNPGLTSTMLVRRDPRLIKDLAIRVPSVHIKAASPTSLPYLVVALMHPWQIMSAWRVTHRSLMLLRTLFLLNSRTRIVRVDFHAPATNRDQIAPFDEKKLMIDNFRILAQTAGFKTHAVGSPASLPIAAIMPKKFALAARSYIVLHPFGSNEFKSLPNERCRSILQALALAHPPLSFVVTGSAQDGPAAQALVEGLSRTQAAVGLPILEVAGLIQNSALYIGIDTGITHLAAMMGKKMLALEHAEYSRWFPVYNSKATVLLNDPADTREGIWGIDNSAILAEVKKLLA